MITGVKDKVANLIGATLIKQRKIKNRKERDQLLISKRQFNFSTSQRIKTVYLLIQFSKIVLLLSKKCQLKIVLETQGASSASIIFFEIRNLRFFLNNKSVFCLLIAFIDSFPTESMNEHSDFLMNVTIYLCSSVNFLQKNFETFASKLGTIFFISDQKYCYLGLKLKKKFLLGKLCWLKDSQSGRFGIINSQIKYPINALAEI